LIYFFLLFLSDVSGDDGKSWVTAELHQPCADGSSAKVYGWCLWAATIPIKRNVRIVSRAGMVLLIFTHIIYINSSQVDSAGNVQQEYPVWNYRGVMNNSWRTVDTTAHANL
jgi:sulfite oxidase